MTDYNASVAEHLGFYRKDAAILIQTTRIMDMASPVA